MKSCRDCPAIPMPASSKAGVALEDREMSTVFIATKRRNTRPIIEAILQDNPAAIVNRGAGDGEDRCRGRWSSVAKPSRS